MCVMSTATVSEEASGEESVQPEWKRKRAAAIHICGALFTFVFLVIAYLALSDEYLIEHTKNALNWHIVFIGLATVFSVLGVFTHMGIAWIGMLVALVTGAFAITAAVKAMRGTVWKYPFAPEIL